MGCYLITETMTRRHELSLESYDRLFPNQDTLPRGGFGNLIALPLQHAARQRGNTVFVDDALVPFPDQWAFLAGIRPIDPATVEAIADEGTRRGEIIGLQISQTEDVDAEKPWAVPSSRRPKAVRLTEPVPAEVRVVLAQRLFIEKGAPAIGPAEPDQAPRGLPESGVLPAAEGSPVDGAHAAGDRLRRGATTASGASPRLRRGPGRAAREPWCDAPRGRSAGRGSSDRGPLSR